MKYTKIYRGTISEDVPSWQCSHSGMSFGAHESTDSSGRQVKYSGEKKLSAMGKNIHNYGLVSQLGNLTLSSSGGSEASGSQYCPSSSVTSCRSCSSVVSNEYLYSDEDEGISLIERHYPSVLSAASSIYSETPSQSFFRRSHDSDLSNLSFKSASLPPSLHDMSDGDLREELARRGDVIGPVTATTRKVYLLRLLGWQRGLILSPINMQAPQHDFSPELHKVLRTGLVCLLSEDEVDESGGGPRPAQAKVWDGKLTAEYDGSQPDAHRGEKLREGRAKMSFNYLLLDPRITRNLPMQVGVLSEDEMFTLFVHSVIYVGKGKQDRPYSHFYEAVRSMERRGDKKVATRALSSKVSKIHEIWCCGAGVVSLHINHNIIPVEAYTREALIIDALTLHRLTNMQRGQYYGHTVKSLDARQRQRFGSYLLYRAMQVLLADGERQIRPVDL